MRTLNSNQLYSAEKLTLCHILSMVKGLDEYIPVGKDKNCPVPTTNVKEIRLHWSSSLVQWEGAVPRLETPEPSILFSLSLSRIPPDDEHGWDADRHYALGSQPQGWGVGCLSINDSTCLSVAFLLVATGRVGDGHSAVDRSTSSVELSTSLNPAPNIQNK